MKSNITHFTMNQMRGNTQERDSYRTIPALFPANHSGTPAQSPDFVLSKTWDVENIDLVSESPSPILRVCSPKITFNASSLFLALSPETRNNEDSAGPVATYVKDENDQMKRSLGFPPVHSSKRLDASSSFPTARKASHGGTEMHFTEFNTTSQMVLRGCNGDSTSSNVCSSKANVHPSTKASTAESWIGRQLTVPTPSQACKGLPPCTPPEDSLKVRFNPSSLFYSETSKTNKTSQQPVYHEVDFSKSSEVALDEGEILDLISGPPSPVLQIDSCKLETSDFGSCGKKDGAVIGVDCTESNGTTDGHSATSPVYSPRVTFNALSLGFPNDCEMEDRLPPINEMLAASDSPIETRKSPRVQFDASSMFDVFEKSGPGEDTSGSEENDLHSISAVATSGKSASLNEDVGLKPSSTVEVGSNGNQQLSEGEPRSILKKRKPLSSNEKTVADCLKLVCKITISEREQMLSLIRLSATEVFHNLCFDQFFRKGECFSSSCSENHHYKPHKFYHAGEKLWNASLYVICYAAAPNLQIVKNLVQHFAENGSITRTLLFAKCVAKVKDSERLELAHFLVNILSGIYPRRDVITVILMLNFSELSSPRYNTLMEGLGVFEHNTTHYSELLNFLNYQGYKAPSKFLLKLMEDSMEYCNNTMVECIAGFLKRMHPSQIEEVQHIAARFLEQFEIALDSLKPNEDGLHYEPREKRSKSSNKKVQFSSDNDVREFEVLDEPMASTYSEGGASDVCSDEDDDENNKPDSLNFYVSQNHLSESIVRVFGESCCAWLLNGTCPSAVCSLLHDFSKEMLEGISSEDVYVAAEFIISQAVCPSLKILKVFLKFLAESNEIGRVLQFRKCTTKLNTHDNVTLTRMIMSFLSKQMGMWEAIEKLLVPNLDPSGVDDDFEFLFDKELLCSIMQEAVANKVTVLRYVSNAIMRRLAMLPASESAEIIEVSTAYMQKFVLTGRNLPLFPDILPLKRIDSNSFASHLKVALYNGVPNKFFLATAMIKLAVQESFTDQALDVLYTFLLSYYDRARVLTYMLINCAYFTADTKKVLAELLGAVGLTTSIHLYENENLEGTAELLSILKKFKFNIFDLLESHGNMSKFNLAVIFCSVIVNSPNRSESIDVFLNHCMPSLGDSANSSATPVCPPELVKLTAKMFKVFTSASLIEDSLKLFNGIILHQRSIVTPLNIVEFVEPVLRCTFHQQCNPKLRRESLKLYLDVIDSGTLIPFQKVTYRSVFLTALMEVTSASQKTRVKGPLNIIHPLMKKILIKCISEGVYPKLDSSLITLYSSMTANEIKVYVLWWFFLYVRARKKQSIDHFPALSVVIVQDCIQDEFRLPIHNSLKMVDPGVSASAERLASVIKNLISEPLLPSTLTSKSRCVLELHPIIVRGLSQVAICLMKQYGYIDSEVDRMCTFCFDKIEVNLADKL